MSHLETRRSSGLRSCRTESERSQGRVYPRVPLQIPDPAINDDAVAIDQIIDGYGANSVIPGIDFLRRRRCVEDVRESHAVFAEEFRGDRPVVRDVDPQDHEAP